MPSLLNRRIALGGLSSIWAIAMLVLGLRLLLHSHTPTSPAMLCLALALIAAAIGLFTQCVANRMFPARSRRLSDPIELALGVIFILSLATAGTFLAIAP